MEGLTFLPLTHVFESILGGTITDIREVGDDDRESVTWCELVVEAKAAPKLLVRFPISRHMQVLGTTPQVLVTEDAPQGNPDQMTVDEVINLAQAEDTVQHKPGCTGTPVWGWRNAKYVGQCHTCGQSSRGVARSNNDGS